MCSRAAGLWHGRLCALYLQTRLVCTITAGTLRRPPVQPRLYQQSFRDAKRRSSLFVGLEQGGSAFQCLGERWTHWLLRSRVRTRSAWRHHIAPRRPHNRRRRALACCGAREEGLVSGRPSARALYQTRDLSAQARAAFAAAHFMSMHPVRTDAMLSARVRACLPPDATGTARA